MTVKDLRTLVDNLDEYIHVSGGIVRLKKTILHLAVSGQLVPQDPSEGTGEQLYQQIQAEKQKLIADGKLKKQKPLTEVDNDETPFDIPKSWMWIKLGDLADYKKGPFGSALTKSMFVSRSEYTVKVYEQKNAIRKDARLGEYYIRSDYYESKMKGFSVEPGDIIVSCAGTIGEMYVLPDDCEKGIINQALMRVRLSESMLKPYYLYILDLAITSNMHHAMGTAIKNIPPFAVLKNIPVPLPPAAEQERIVKKIEAVFRLIDELAEKYKAEQEERRKLVVSSLSKLSKDESTLALKVLTGIIKTKADAAELRKTILHLAVSGQLVSQDPSAGTGEQLYQQIQAEKQELITHGKLKKQKPLPEITEDEIPFEIPVTWKWARVGDLADVFNGNSINASEKKLRYEKVMRGYPYLGTKDVGYGFERIDYDNGVKVPFDEKNFRIIPAGTALICSEGGSAGKKCGIVDRDVAFGNKMYAFMAHGNLIVPDFVLYNYLSKQFYEQFSDRMTGIIGGISTASFRQLLIPVPSLDEQKRIVAKTTQLLNLVIELERQFDS